MQCFHILSFHCQSLSHFLGLLAVRLNELELGGGGALIYNLQQNKTYSEVNGLSSSRSDVNK